MQLFAAALFGLRSTRVNPEERPRRTKSRHSGDKRDSANDVRDDRPCSGHDMRKGQSKQGNPEDDANPSIHSTNVADHVSFSFSSITDTG
jgi:hypothetical protein